VAERFTAKAEWLEGLALATVVARRDRNAALKMTVREALGLTLPEGPRYVVAGACAALGTAPGAWLLIDEASGGGWAGRLADLLKGLGSVADQSDAYVGVRVSGPDSQAALSRGVGVDLHDRSFPVGASAVTAAAHLGLVLWRPAAQVFDILCYRSYAGDFRLWLQERGIQIDGEPGLG
jgi:sarcosine oxidase subunit gamma